MGKLTTRYRADSPLLKLVAADIAVRREKAIGRGRRDGGAAVRGESRDVDEADRGNATVAR